MADLKAKVILELVDRITGPAKRVSSAFRGIARDANLAQLATDARAVGFQFGRVTSEAGILARRIRTIGLAAGAATLGAGGLIGFTARVAGVAEEIQNAARKIGIGVEELQELRAVADQVGIPVESLDMNLEQFVKRIGQAARSTGAAKKTFRGLGIDLKDSGGKMKSAGQLFEEVAEKISTIPEASERARLLNELFGRSGLELLPMLEEGADGIRKMRETVRPGIFDAAATNNLVAFDAQMDALKPKFTGLRNAIIGETLPAVSKLVNWLSELISNNEEAIKESVLTAFRVFGAVLKGVGMAVSLVAKMMGGWKNLIAVVSLLISGKLILSLLGLARSLLVLGRTFAFVALRIGMASLALLATPFGWVLAGAVALGTAAYFIIKNWDQVSMAIGDAVDAVRARLSAVVDALKQKWSEFTEWLMGKLRAIREMVPDFVATGFKFSTNVAKTAFGAPARAGEAIGSALGLRKEKTEVGGELKIRIDSEGRPRVTDLRKRGGMELDVDSGVMAVGY